MWWLLIPILLYFSYTDWKTREINDYFVYASFVLGLLFNLHKGMNLLLSLTFTAIVALPLYLAGAFALGDLWVSLIIAAFIPEFIMGVPLAVLSLLGGIALGGLYGFFKVIARRPKEWLDLWFRSVAYGVAFSTNPLLGIVLAYTLSECYPVLFLLLPVSHSLLYYVGTFVLASTAWKILRTAGEYFTVDKEPEEGDIPAEVVDEKGRKHPIDWKTWLKIKRGELKPAHSIGADGLTKEDVEKLKNLGVRTIKVKEPLPLVPFITMGLIILLLINFFL